MIEDQEIIVGRDTIILIEKIIPLEENVIKEEAGPGAPTVVTGSKPPFGFQLYQPPAVNEGSRKLGELGSVTSRFKLP